MPTTLTAETLTDTRTRVTATFTPLGSSTPTDPSAVSMSTRAPDGTISTKVYGTDAEVVKVSDGVFYLDVVATAEGIWWVQARGTGATGIRVKGEISIKANGSVIP